MRVTSRNDVIIFRTRELENGPRDPPNSCPSQGDKRLRFVHLHKTLTIEPETNGMPRKFLRPDRRRALYASTAWFIGQLPMSAALKRVRSRFTTMCTTK